MRRLLISAALAVLCCACASKSYISKNYDFNQMQHIGILAFTSPGGKFEGAETVFAKNLIKYGYTVVERAQIEKVLKERGFQADGYLPPEATRELGKILGVDVLLAGQITSYLPAQKTLAYNVSKINSTEPVLRSEVINTPEGGTTIKTDVAGTRKRRERSVTPYEYTIFAQAGVSAKMIDVNTAEIIWAGDDTAEGQSGLDAVSTIAARLMKDFDSQVRKARKRR